jgi:hypothetical protein
LVSCAAQDIILEYVVGNCRCISYRVPTDQLPLLEDEAGNKLYEGCQYLTNANGTASLLAGSTFGGGGVVNWGASLQVILLLIL